MLLYTIVIIAGSYHMHVKKGYTVVTGTYIRTYVYEINTNYHHLRANIFNSIILTLH